LTGESFDDGQADIPAGVAGPVERVVVIGAGIAGLTVANALTHGGIECVVVEARDRIGGRLHTVNLAGSPVDLGGSWIHTPGGNPMRAFADQAGVRCRSANPLPELAAFDCGEGRRLSAAEVETNIAMQLDDFPQARGRLLAELGPDASAADGIEAFVAGAGLAPGPARRARQALRALVEGESADLAERQSLRWMWNEMEYEGHYFGDAPEGGYRRLAEAMAAGVDLRLGVDVAEIACSAGGVRVHTADGTSEDGSHVVVTVPLGVLKRGAPQFRPALPPDRLAAIERLGFGRYEKVALRFDEPFWRTAGLPHAMIFPRDSSAPAVWAIGLDAFGGSALTAPIDVPKGRSAGEMGAGIPVTYVPARNTIFLSFALAWAEVLESSHIFIGVNALDYSGYPDCRPEFIEAYERMANLATKAAVEGRTRVKIHTPLLQLSKAGIVKLGAALGLSFGLTMSCYDPGPNGAPCGHCDACLLRRKGFDEAGIEDR